MAGLPLLGCSSLTPSPPGSGRGMSLIARFHPTGSSLLAGPCHLCQDMAPPDWAMAQPWPPASVLNTSLLTKDLKMTGWMRP